MQAGGQAELPSSVLAAAPPLGFAGMLLLYGGAGLLLWGATHWIIPALAARTEVEPVVLWFIVSGGIVFSPILVAAAVLLHWEGSLSKPGLWRNRLRFRPMTKADWLWCLASLVVIGALVAVTMTSLQMVWGKAPLQPAFLSMEPLSRGRYWILAAWLPFWALNVMAEEILWRGVVLPRQEAAFGRWAWLANGAGWLLFHLPFGAAILLTVGPTTVLLPYVVQRRQNSWMGVVIHAGLNGPGFLAVAFGLA